MFLPLKPTWRNSTQWDYTCEAQMPIVSFSIASYQQAIFYWCILMIMMQLIITRRSFSQAHCNNYSAKSLPFSIQGTVFTTKNSSWTLLFRFGSSLEGNICINFCHLCLKILKWLVLGLLWKYCNLNLQSCF